MLSELNWYTEKVGSKVMEVGPVRQTSQFGLSQPALDYLRKQLEALRIGGAVLEEFYDGRELAELQASQEAREREIASLETLPERVERNRTW